MISSPFGKLFKRGGKRGRDWGERRRKGSKKDKRDGKKVL